MTLSERECRGLGIVAEGGQIVRLSDGLFLVRSQSTPDHYVVSWDNRNWRCGCTDFVQTRDICKHMFALHWVYALPVVLASNSGVTSGSTVADTAPRLTYVGRSIPVHDLVAVYRTALNLVRTIPTHSVDRPTTTTKRRPILTVSRNADMFGA